MTEQRSEHACPTCGEEWVVYQTGHEGYPWRDYECPVGHTWRKPWEPATPDVA